MSGAHARFMARMAAGSRLAKQQRRVHVRRLIIEGAAPETARVRQELHNLRGHNAMVAQLSRETSEKYHAQTP